MKLIYKPKGAAGEYARYAVNFYLGCPHGCKYCYLKRGVSAKVLGGDTPTLRAGYDNIIWELNDFKSDLMEKGTKLREKGIFFSFTTDPLIKETYQATIDAVEMCFPYQIPTTILTKCADYYDALEKKVDADKASLVTVGTTLTGFDNLEPRASKNSDRIDMLKRAKRYGFNTFVSLEPIIDLETSIQMMCSAAEYTDEFRIGLKTPVKASNYPEEGLRWFIKTAKAIGEHNGVRLVWKVSVRKLAAKYGLEDMLP